MKVYVTTLTDHRIDKQLSTWFCAALTRIDIDYTVSPQDMYSCDVCVMFNGVLTPAGQARIDTISDMMPVLYMYDDCDLDIPTNATIVSQFTNTGDIWFPISKLACFSKYWDNPIKKPKRTMWFYGGTYKERRDYSELSKLNDLLICGDDERWDEFSDNRFPTIRDMDILYHLMSTCHNTVIVPDAMHDGINMPLRFYEGVFCDVQVRLGSTLWPPRYIKASVNVNEVLRQIKDILNGTKNKEELCLPKDDVAEELYEAVPAPKDGAEVKEILSSDELEDFWKTNELKDFWKTNEAEEFYAKELYDGVCATEEPLYGKTNKHSDIHTTTNTSEILEQRGAVYGSYKEGVSCRANILSALKDKYEETNLKSMSDTLLVMFSDLALKLMRAASDPTHLDSWVDLEGYARLIKETMEDELSTRH